MLKISIIRRVSNSRRFRKLNSVTDLVGQEVEVTNDTEVEQAEVEEVSVDSDNEVTLSLDNGDDVVLEESEAEDLIETGTAIADDESEDAPEETEEFAVTRDIVAEDGTVNEVTTAVEAPSEDEAIETVKLLDSRRRRNSRKYRIANSRNSRIRNSRKNNSEGDVTVYFAAICPTESGYSVVNFTANNEDEAESIKAGYTSKCGDKGDCTPVFTKISADPVKVNDEVTAYMNLRKVPEDMVEYSSYNCDKRKNSIYRISRRVNGKVCTAVVKAKNSDDAIETLVTSDESKGVDGTDYREVTETADTTEAPVTEEVAPAVAEEGQTEVPESQEEAQTEEVSEVTEDNLEIPADTTEAEGEGEGEDERSTNSFKGVAAFVARKYGIKM